MNQCPYCKKFLLESEECNCGLRTPIKKKEKDELGENGKVILTAVIYPLLVQVAALAFVAQENPKLIILSILCTIFAAVCTVIAGVYLLVIPLPIITYYRIGSVANKFPLYLRIICGILAIGFLLLSIFIFFI